MKIQAPPGMRDLYPDDMRLQNWLFDAWRGVSRDFGFVEYDGPIFEYLELYTLKSGEGIAGELFNFQDRGGRSFAIRPEMTPTLARMVAARANALPRPIKWFSIPRLCRAEKPQRGRLREFFQWNIDTLGHDDMLADAEVIAALAEFYRRVGASPAEVAIRVNSRDLASAVLSAVGMPASQMDRAFAAIDRYDAANPDEFMRRWQDAPKTTATSSSGPSELTSGSAATGSIAPGAPSTGASAGEPLAAFVPTARLLELLKSDFETCAATVAASSPATGSPGAAQLRELFDLLTSFGVSEYCRFDLSIVRGLAYYTGPVFEASALAGNLRALAGGGRYDNLTSLLDGPRVTGVGFGMGDAPNIEFLRDLGKLPVLGEGVTAFVIDLDESAWPDAVSVLTRLRRAGISADCSYRRAALGKQLKAASARGSQFAVLVGTEYRATGTIDVKCLRTAQQQRLLLAALLADPAGTLARLSAGPA
ncbi:MAG: histidine--tRNA ligase [Planctomycetia bacterium]|nr:MAG: histidine--tRNA ligase [Planctomycetia bacterium]